MVAPLSPTATSSIDSDLHEAVSNMTPASTVISMKAVTSTGYRGRCRYKTGNCPNERAAKLNGEAHTLCEKHRKLHNQNQRKSDRKRRAIRKMAREGKNQSRFHSAKPFTNICVSPYSKPRYEDSYQAFNLALPEEDSAFEMPQNTSAQYSWSSQEIDVLQQLLTESTYVDGPASHIRAQNFGITTTFGELDMML